MVDDADGWTISSHTTRRARKRHECVECRRTIMPGETYQYTTGLYEDHWDDFKMCAHCLAASSWLMVVCSGWLFNAVLEDLEEHWNESWELRSHYLGRAIIGMRRQWRKRDGTLMPVMRQFTKADLRKILAPA